MILDDLFDEQQDPTQQSANALQQLMDKNASLTKQIETLKNAKTPRLDAPASDEIGPLSDDLLRGFFRAGMPPDSQAPDFGSMFRKSVSPGRELLANMLNGVSSSLLGTKFQTVREEAFDRYQKEQKLGMEQQQLRRQIMFNMANLAQDVYKQRGEEAMRRSIENVRAAQNDEDRAMKLVELQQNAQKFGFDVDKFLTEENRRRDEFLANQENQGPPLYKAARQNALAQLKLNNTDLESPAGQVELANKTVAEWQRLESLQAQVKGENRPAPLPYVMPIQGPDGNQYAAIIDKRSGQVVGGSFIGRKLTAEQLDSVNNIRNASANIRNALVAAQNNPDAIGGFAQQLPADLRARVGALPASERSLRLYLNTAISSYIQSVSGKAVTDSERRFLTEGLPKTYEKPENFYPAAYAFAGMLDAAAMRSQYGLDVDLVKPMQTYMEKMSDYIKKNGSAKGLPILSSQQFLDYALKGYGKKLQKGQFGTMELVDDK